MDPAETWPATEGLLLLLLLLLFLFVCVFVLFLFCFFPRVDHLPDSLYSYKWLKKLEMDSI